MRSLFSLILVAACLTLVGCAATRDKKALLRYENELRPEVGQETVETYVKRWGTPTQRMEVADGELLCWRISHGSRSGGVGFILSVGQSYEQYDDIRLKFDHSHVLRDFTVECMR